jgi:hypothetical protein
LCSKFVLTQFLYRGCHDIDYASNHKLNLVFVYFMQVLAQSHAEHCCHSLLNNLLDIYKPTDTRISVIDIDYNGMTTSDNSNSSLEIYE